MNHPYLGIAGAIIAAAGGLYYLYTIFFGNTRPQRVTWGLWTLIGILGAGSAVQGGAHAGSYVALTYVFMEVTFFVVSLTKYGKKGGKTSDYYLAALAVLAIMIWRFGHLSASFAATIAVVGDGIGLWFTLREAWRQPKTESLLSWAVDVPAAGLGIAASASFSYGAIAYSAYLLAGNAAVTTVLAIRHFHPKKA